MKKGLIMEGGAMRGMFTAGVIDVLMEQGIEFDGAIGVSAGAAFGCNYKSKQIGRVIRYNTRFSQDKRYGGFRVLLKEGNFYSTKFCLTVEIRDSGKGIEDIEKAMEPMYTSCPEAERSGMGFTVMETFMDSVKVSSVLGVGTKVTMKKIIRSRLL